MTEERGPNRLFVYGTLAPGRSNADVLADVPGVWEPATVTGTLLPEGWARRPVSPALSSTRTARPSPASSSALTRSPDTGRASTRSRVTATYVW